MKYNTVIYHDGDLDGITSSVVIADMERRAGNRIKSTTIRRPTGATTNLFDSAEEAASITSIYILDYHPSAAELAILDSFYTSAVNKYIVDHHQLGDILEYLPEDWQLVHPEHFGKTNYKLGNQSTVYLAAMLHVMSSEFSDGKVSVGEDGLLRFTGDMALIQAISDRDCGRHDNAYAMEISCGLMQGDDWKDYQRLRNILFSEPGVFRSSTDPIVTQMREHGAIVRTTLSSIAQSISTYAAKVKCGRYTASILNSSFMISDIGNQMTRDPEVDFAIVYFITTTSVIFCMRSHEDAEDVGRLATLMGGGGQTHASSFSFRIGPGMSVLDRLRRGKLDIEAFNKEEEKVV